MDVTPAWSPPRWVVPLFAAAALVLLPWIVLLVRELPSAHRSRHWDVAWGGFDVALAVTLAAVAVAAARRSPWLEGAATAAATLLLVDAWFDVLTASTGSELALAIAEAALVEVPLAILCLLLARDAERRLLRPRLAIDASRKEHACSGASSWRSTGRRTAPAPSRRRSTSPAGREAG